MSIAHSTLSLLLITHYLSTHTTPKACLLTHTFLKSFQFNRHTNLSVSLNTPTATMQPATAHNASSEHQHSAASGAIPNTLYRCPSCLCDPCTCPTPPTPSPPRSQPRPDSPEPDEKRLLGLSIRLPGCQRGDSMRSEIVPDLVMSC